MSVTHAFFRRHKQSKASSIAFYDHRDVEIPIFSTYDVGHVKEGVRYKISGFLPVTCERFAVHLVLDNPASDIALRINPRLPQNYIVRTTRINNRWTEDEDSSVLPFTLKRGSHFIMEILITDQRYMISVNAQHFAKYNHRAPYQALRCIQVVGDVNQINIERSEVLKYPDRSNETGPNPIRIISNLDRKSGILNHKEIKENIGERLPLPYYGLLPSETLGFGKQLRLMGRIKLLPLSFYVNLQEGQNIWPHPIIAFHFRCRFARHHDYIGRNVITCNSWFEGKYGNEEISEMTTDLLPGKTFNLVVVRGKNAFEVYANEKFLVDFKFRFNPDKVDTVYVLGDIKLGDIVLEDHDETIYRNPRLEIYHSTDL